MLLILIKVVYVFLHLFIGVYDFSFYRIPNLLLGALLVLYGFYAPFYVEGGELLRSLGVFVLIFAVGFGFYALKFFGAGDAKYLAVTSLWVGSYGILPFVLIVAVVGGFLGLIYLTFRDHLARLSDWAWSQIQRGEERSLLCQFIWTGSGSGAERGKRENISSRMIPYGLAIAAGAIIMMTLNPIGY